MNGVKQLEALGSLQKSREVQATGSLWGVGGKRNLSPASLTVLNVPGIHELIGILRSRSIAAALFGDQLKLLALVFEFQRWAGQRLNVVHEAETYRARPEIPQHMVEFAVLPGWAGRHNILLDHRILQLV